MTKENLSILIRALRTIQIAEVMGLLENIDTSPLELVHSSELLSVIQDYGVLLDE